MKRRVPHKHSRARYLHNVIFRYVAVSNSPHSVISLAVLLQAHYPSSYSNLPLTSTLLLVDGAYPTRLEQLLKYQLGVWGAPRGFYGHFYTKSYQQTTSVKISSVE